MIHFEPMSGLSVVFQNTPPDTSDVIAFYPSIINDLTASTDELISSDSVRSFMQTQWRMAAANMIGVGVIVSGWA